MMNSEQSKHSVASLSEQILFVMNRTSNYAHTSVYGDTNIENEKIGRFQGQKQPSNSAPLKKLFHQGKLSHF